MSVALLDRSAEAARPLYVEGVPEPVLQGLSALARYRDMSRAQLVREVLAAHVSAAAEALSELERGRVPA